MKLIYTTLFLVFTITISAQEIANLQPAANEEIADIKLYPNPAFDDVVYITTKHNAPKTIIIYDIFGAVVLKDRIVDKALSISQLTAGVYLMNISEKDKTTTKKLVVK